MNHEGSNGLAKRGFALLNSEKQREIARQGGQAAHRKGAAHEFSSDEAREAGRKGGLRISADRAHMARIGRAGGKARRAKRNENAPEPQPAMQLPGGHSERQAAAAEHRVIHPHIAHEQAAESHASRAQA